MAAVAGRRVLIADAVPGAARRAVWGIREQVKAQAAKGRIDVDPDALDLSFVDSAAGLAGCGIVIEAIVEDLGVKRALFAQLEGVLGRRDPRVEDVVALADRARGRGWGTRNGWSGCTSSIRCRR